MDWHTFFKELKDSGRGAGLFVLLMVGGFVSLAAIVFGGELLLNSDWLILLIRSLQAVLALSLCALVGLPLFAWRGRKRRPPCPRSLGSYAPHQKHARQL